MHEHLPYYSKPVNVNIKELPGLVFCSSTLEKSGQGKRFWLGSICFSLSGIADYLIKGVVMGRICLPKCVFSEMAPARYMARHPAINKA